MYNFKWPHSTGTLTKDINIVLGLSNSQHKRQKVLFDLIHTYTIVYIFILNTYQHGREVNAIPTFSLVIYYYKHHINYRKMLNTIGTRYERQENMVWGGIITEGGFGNETVVDRVPPNMFHLIDPSW